MPLIGENGLRDQLEAMILTLTNYGDLVECPLLGDAVASSMALYVAPPAFVRRESGVLLLLGVRPEGMPLVGADLLDLIEYERHIRTIKPGPGTDLAQTLIDDGLTDLPADRWLRCPREASPIDAMTPYTSRLSAAPTSGRVEGLMILDPSTRVTYYKGRWRQPRSADNGRFVAQRPQGFGSDIWCYVELIDGMPIRLIDLPIAPELGRGCDEAWRLQAAIDALSGRPQRISMTWSGDRNRGVVQLFAPPPRWLQRRMDSIGVPVTSPGALVAYGMPALEAREEVEFARRMLWMEEGAN